MKNVKRTLKSNEDVIFRERKTVPCNPAAQGSSFDDFLREEGLYDSVHAAALKRVFAFQMTQAMKEDKITKADVARRMHTSRSQVDRLLDPEVSTIQLDLLVRAAQSIGRNFTFTLIKEKETCLV